jgi:type IV secretory pathway VirJ component
MDSFRISILALAMIFFSGPALALDGGRYGEVRMTVPTGPVRGYVVLFSDAGGWSNDDQSALEELARQGALAVGVDTDAYLARVASVPANCDQLVGDVEGLSRQLQREHAGAEYYFPILAGIGEGGALAGAILAQSPANTVDGAVSLDPRGVIQTKHRFCPRVPSAADDGLHSYWGIPVLHQFWNVGLTPAEPAGERAHFETLQALVAQLSVQTMSPTDRGQLLASLIAPHLDRDNLDGVAALPLVELPAAQPTRLMAVFLSGDGGWRDIDKTIGENLQSLGVSVVGWDSVRYFWRKKSPEQTAADLSAVITTYSAKWHADKVALIGFSFGADVLPFAYDRLRPAVKQHIAMMSLLSLGPAADWEIRVVGWLGAPPSAEATPIEPEIQGVPGAMIQCFYGDQDRESYCPALEKRGAEVIEKKGIHHFDGNYIYMAQQILAAFKRRAGDGT